MCYGVHIIHKTRKRKHQNSHRLFSNCSFQALITSFLHNLITDVLKNDLSFDQDMQIYVILHFNHKNCCFVEIVLL